MKRKYQVIYQEVWNRSLEVEAESKEEADKLAKVSFENGIEDGCFEYSTTILAKDVYELE